MPQDNSAIYFCRPFEGTGEGVLLCYCRVCVPVLSLTLKSQITCPFNLKDN